MRIRNIKNAEEIVNSSNYVITNPTSYKNNINKIFNNNNPIHLEIGMGKGDFIIDKAIKNPNINFIGIEKYQSIIVRAIKKIENLKINNIRIICIDAKELDTIFNEDIETIYLNFSDPWPKKRHAKRRLTSDTFLNIYKNISKKKQIIIQKTDNESLFEYSIKSFNNNGYIIDDISLDLHNRQDIDNSLTEYEKKFSSKGIKIKYIKVIK